MDDNFVESENTSKNNSTGKLVSHPVGQKKLSTLPWKGFKYENEYGFFKVYIYLNRYYNIIYEGHLITERYDYLGEMSIAITAKGAVDIWAPSDPYDFGPRRKRFSGFIITDKEDLEEIRDYIKCLKGVSTYMKKTHQRNRYLTNSSSQ